MYGGFNGSYSGFNGISEWGLLDVALVPLLCPEIICSMMSNGTPMNSVSNVPIIPDSMLYLKRYVSRAMSSAVKSLAISFPPDLLVVHVRATNDNYSLDVDLGTKIKPDFFGKRD